MAKPDKKKPDSAGAATAVAEPVPVPRLYTKFTQEIRPALRSRFGVKSDLAVPRLDKIVLNMGVGRARDNKALVDTAAADLATTEGWLARTPDDTWLPEPDASRLANGEFELVTT